MEVLESGIKGNITMNFAKENLNDLSINERFALSLTEATSHVLKYVQAGYVFVKVDLAVMTSQGLIIYSYNNGCEVNKYLVAPDETLHFDYSPGSDIPGSNYSLLREAGLERISKIFRNWEAKESFEYPRTMLSNLEYIGEFEGHIKMYAVAIGYKKAIENKELFQLLFKTMISHIHTQMMINNVKRVSDFSRFDLSNINSSGVMKETAIKFLSSKFYGSETHPQKEELYETLCLLSSIPYEKSPNKGRLGIATPKVISSKTFVRFTTPIELKQENVKLIRKLLEISDKNHTILISEEGRVIGVHAIKTNSGKYEGTGVMFSGYGKWDLFSGKNSSIISFNSVTIGLVNQSLDRRLQKGFEYAGLQYNKQRIQKVVHEAKKQSHGTTIIVTDQAESESIRLQNANRAIGIRPVLVDESTILSLSAIDGAMIVNTEGICYSIGAILDGAATGKGNIARGARYNSAITYVDYWAKNEPRKKVVAIIVSADDSVDIYPNSNQFLNKLL